jgi:hypothetical protein
VADLTALLALAALLAGTIWLTWAITHNYHHNKNTNRDARLEHLLHDRTNLLQALGHLVNAVHDPHLHLEKAVAQAQDAIDGRWTP